MIRKEPRKLFIKTYKVVVFQYAIDFLQQLSESAFVLCPDFNKVLCGCCTLCTRCGRVVTDFLPYPKFSRNLIS